MQKFMTGAMALAILASTGAASAQGMQDNPAMRRSWRNPPPGEAPRAPEARQAREASPAAQAPRAEDHGQRGGRDDGARGDRGGRGPGDGDSRRWDGGPYRGNDNRGGPARPGDDGRRGDDNRRGDDRRDWNDRNDRDRRDWNDGRRWNDGRPGDNGRRWDNDDRRRDQPRPRYDRRSYEPIWRSQQRFRGWTYRPPSGFFVRSWSYGDMLPRSWWGNDYRIMDWWSYGLPTPPLGYEWVRVGNDALLVDMYSGRVVQVAYDLFW